MSGGIRLFLASGGYIASLLPGAPEELIDALEKNVMRTGPVTDVLKDGGADDLVRAVLDGFEPKILERSPVEYRCYCSQERVMAAVASIGREELEDIKQKGEPVEVTCPVLRCGVFSNAGRNRGAAGKNKCGQLWYESTKNRLITGFERTF